VQWLASSRHAQFLSFGVNVNIKYSLGYFTESRGRIEDAVSGIFDTCIYTDLKTLLKCLDDVLVPNRWRATLLLSYASLPLHRNSYGLW
jgi:hypothetical protein